MRYRRDAAAFCANGANFRNFLKFFPDWVLSHQDDVPKMSFFGKKLNGANFFLCTVQAREELFVRYVGIY